MGSDNKKRLAGRSVVSSDGASVLDAQRLARHAGGADGEKPLFPAPDGTRPAAARHIQNWLARISRETSLRFDITSGWNRYTTPAWATFHQLATRALIAR